jgi:hypothetical protein
VTADVSNILPSHSVNSMFYAAHAGKLKKTLLPVLCLNNPNFTMKVDTAVFAVIKLKL